jgi:ATP-dependent RNA circularization protein (DNA/RNA ligase family)
MILKNSVYGTIMEWDWTEKIDGMNIRAIWQDGKLTFGGKTDNAQIHADLIKWLYENITPEKMATCFANGENVVIYGEGYGAGIQKGGGSYSATKQFIVFDVFVVDTVNTKLGGWWLSDDNMRDIASRIGLRAVPLIGRMSLEEAANMVRIGFNSQVGSQQAEGLVGRPVETLFDKKGHRLIVKLKTKDF